MEKNKDIIVFVSTELDEALEKLVSKGIFKSKEEAIRVAVYKLIDFFEGDEK